MMRKSIPVVLVMSECSTNFRITSAPLRFVKNYMTAVSSLDQKFFLLCELNKPSNDILWSFDGDRIKEDRRKTIRISDGGKKHILEILDFNTEDRGKYVVKSRTQNAYTKAIIDLAIAPSLFVPDDNVTAHTGGGIIIPVQCKGIPRPKYQLYKEVGDQLLPMDDEYLEIEHEQLKVMFCKPMRSDSGKYQIAATNKHGKSHAKFDLLVIGKPSSPIHLTVTEVTSSSVSLIWSEPEEDGGSPITKFLVEKRDIKRKMWQSVSDDVEDTEITVNKLIEGSSYLFRVSCENRVGLSQPVQLVILFW
uniref:titin-like n=1 Tax=Styela clava TaxID=7725 RepID=UPI00193A71B7|nr:titin-like [Styela clava]